MSAVNPWNSGTPWHGIRAVYYDAESRIERARTMTKSQLIAAFNWPDTQKTVAIAISRRLRKLRMEKGAT